VASNCVCFNPNQPSAAPPAMPASMAANRFMSRYDISRTITPTMANIAMRVVRRAGLNVCRPMFLRTRR
jgi:hypothetical protein